VTSSREIHKKSEGTRDALKPDIGVSVVAGVSADFIDEFLDGFRSNGFVTDRRNHSGLDAGIEWLMPTAFVLYIAHTFFGAMISEAAKDIYKHLKSSSTELYKKTADQGVVRIGKSGKIETRSAYSLAFSIVVPTDDKLVFKLLLQTELTEQEVAEALGAFLDLMLSFFNGTITPETLGQFEKSQAMGHTLLLAYDFSSRAIVTVDPRPYRDSTSAGS
jgi:hypothetical protein